MPGPIRTIPFEEAVAGLCQERSDGFVFDPAGPESFASLDYADELQLKNASLKVFWKENRLPGNPGPVAASVLPRNYRSNSKRKAVLARTGRFYLVHPGGARNVKASFEPSALEPESHCKVYEYLLEKFSSPAWRHTAANLHYVILRGTEKLALILNYRSLDGETVRKMKQLSESLVKDFSGTVVSFFLYLDETDSKYYLESIHRSGSPFGLKKMFGSAFLDTLLPGGGKLLYPPTAFSQVNASMIPAFLSAADSLLKVSSKTRLLDLYCGYGMIGLSLGTKISSLHGFELDGPAVDAAEANAKHLFPGKEFRFLRGEIGPGMLKAKLPTVKPGEMIVLDPPRSGTVDGVIRTLAARGAEKVLHIFCNVDEIPLSVREWTSRGYSVSGVRALDMFPGTPNLEIMVLFSKNLSGKA